MSKFTLDDIKTDDVKVLGVYRPDALTLADIRRFFARICPVIDDYEIHVRGPHTSTDGSNTNYTVSAASMKWHHDCGRASEFILVWSNMRPTQVRRIDGKRVRQPKAYELVSINNHACQHRARAVPKSINKRWFMIKRILKESLRKEAE